MDGNKNNKSNLESSGQQCSFSELEATTGKLGPWLVGTYMCLSAAAFFNAFHDLGVLFLGGVPDHWCHVDGLNVNWTREQRHNISLPWYLYMMAIFIFWMGESHNGVEGWSQCNMYQRDYAYLSNLSFHEAFEYIQTTHPKTVPCHSWDYDTSMYTSTTVSEWNLVCDRKALLSTIQGTYMVGVLLGAMFFGMLSDRVGRRPALLTASSLQIVSAIGAAFSPNYVVFILLRVLVAMGVTGAYVGGFVLLMELVGSKKRSLMSMLYQIPFSFGYMALPGIAYLIRDWRDLQLAMSVPNILLLSYFWLAPESPRWLVSQGRIEEAEVVIKKAAKFNRMKLPDDPQQLTAAIEKFRSSDEKPEPGTVWRRFLLALSSLITLVRTPEMRRRVLISYFAWFVVALAYYGVALNATNLPGNLFLVTFIMGAVEVPAYLFTAPLIQKFGRKPMTCITLIITGTACLLILAVPAGDSGLSWVIVMLSMVGKLCISSTFGIVYLYVTELMPTVVRNVAIGGASVVARGGSISAPYIVDLLGTYHSAIPSVIFGVSALVCGVVCFWLPETRGEKMPETVADVESWRRRKKSIVTTNDNTEMNHNKY